MYGTFGHSKHINFLGPIVLNTIHTLAFKHRSAKQSCKKTTQIKLTNATHTTCATYFDVFMAPSTTTLSCIQAQICQAEMKKTDATQTNSRNSTRLTQPMQLIWAQLIDDTFSHSKHINFSGIISKGNGF